MSTSVLKMWKIYIELRDNKPRLHKVSTATLKTQYIFAVLLKTVINPLSKNYQYANAYGLTMLYTHHVQPFMSQPC